MKATGERQTLIRQVRSLGERVQTLADTMEGEGRVDAGLLQDLQALIAELTDSASELEQYAESIGGDDFGATIEKASAERRVFLRRVYAWAKSLQSERLCVLSTSQGKEDLVLRCYLPANRSLVTINSSKHTDFLQLYGSVFGRFAPRSLGRVQTLARKRIGQGTRLRETETSPELLAALSAAYREAADKRPFA